MAVKERDVVLTGKSGSDQTIDLPITRLGNIEDTAEVKTKIEDGDFIPIIDGSDNMQMKKVSAKALTPKYKYYGIRIQINNSNPATAVTYIDDAMGMGTGYDAWKDTPIFAGIRPCVLKNGVVQYYLNPGDLTKRENGTAATITSITSGDVMIEIPKLGYKMTKDANYHYIWITDNPNAPGYCYRAHSMTEHGDCDKIYIGAYLGYGSGNKLYSVSGYSPTSSTTLTNFRAWAKARGTGYELVSFYPLTLLQCLYLMMYKDRNGQSAIGKGYVGLTYSGGNKTNTGATNAKGACWGESTGQYQMCFLNIEDFWGNLLWWIDGIYCTSSGLVKTTFNNFNDTGANYPFSIQCGTVLDDGGYMNDIIGTNEGGFVISEYEAGSATTYWADYAFLYPDYCAFFGGHWSDGDYAGPFQLAVDYEASESVAYLGARLMFKHKST